ncbi:uncharacterized protein CMU_038740 [Cryptosporidium muris RN66]|uniref:Cullin family profile domain-containing protein n=1 Tax=Cryptosporidium muris (strain RN66) TaxID=441375 RepID=B6A9B6_CRYMR|nr:uncharacterized protein CMU_038740 [Cryptosporidium muris RN66]EEA04807.1 hypothetical protein, conserved [Cryptosporidium muris RN66]|eukprot:XP_002139156.1 hypothetical protein [Cryptosporidium muris RN66]
MNIQEYPAGCSKGNEKYQQVLGDTILTENNNSLNSALQFVDCNCIRPMIYFLKSIPSGFAPLSPNSLAILLEHNENENITLIQNNSLLATNCLIKDSDASSNSPKYSQCSLKLESEGLKCGDRNNNTLNNKSSNKSLNIIDDESTNTQDEKCFIKDSESCNLGDKHSNCNIHKEPDAINRQLLYSTQSHKVEDFQNKCLIKVQNTNNKGILNSLEKRNDIPFNNIFTNSDGNLNFIQNHVNVRQYKTVISLEQMIFIYNLGGISSENVWTALFGCHDKNKKGKKFQLPPFMTNKILIDAYTKILSRSEPQSNAIHIYMYCRGIFKGYCTDIVAPRILIHANIFLLWNNTLKNGMMQQDQQSDLSNYIHPLYSSLVQGTLPSLLVLRALEEEFSKYNVLVHFILRIFSSLDRNYTHIYSHFPTLGITSLLYFYRCVFLPLASSFTSAFLNIVTIERDYFLNNVLKLLLIPNKENLNYLNCCNNLDDVHSFMRFSICKNQHLPRYPDNINEVAKDCLNYISPRPFDLVLYEVINNIIVALSNNASSQAELKRIKTIFLNSDMVNNDKNSNIENSNTMKFNYTRDNRISVPIDISTDKSLDHPSGLVWFSSGSNDTSIYVNTIEEPFLNNTRSYYCEKLDNIFKILDLHKCCILIHWILIEEARRLHRYFPIKTFSSLMKIVESVCFHFLGKKILDYPRSIDTQISQISMIPKSVIDPGTLKDYLHKRSLCYLRSIYDLVLRDPLKNSSYNIIKKLLNEKEFDNKYKRLEFPLNDGFVNFSKLSGKGINRISCMISLFSVIYETILDDVLIAMRTCRDSFKSDSICTLFQIGDRFCGIQIVLAIMKQYKLVAKASFKNDLIINRVINRGIYDGLVLYIQDLTSKSQKYILMLISFWINSFIDTRVLQLYRLVCDVALEEDFPGTKEHKQCDSNEKSSIKMYKSPKKVRIHIDSSNNFVNTSVELSNNYFNLDKVLLTDNEGSITYNLDNSEVLSCISKEFSKKTNLKLSSKDDQLNFSTQESSFENILKKNWNIGSFERNGSLFEIKESLNTFVDQWFISISSRLSINLTGKKYLIDEIKSITTKLRDQSKFEIFLDQTISSIELLKLLPNKETVISQFKDRFLKRLMVLLYINSSSMINENRFTNIFCLICIEDFILSYMNDNPIFHESYNFDIDHCYNDSYLGLPFNVSVKSIQGILDDSLNMILSSAVNDQMISVLLTTYFNWHKNSSLNYFGDLIKLYSKLKFPRAVEPHIINFEQQYKLKYPYRKISWLWDCGFAIIQVSGYREQYSNTSLSFIFIAPLLIVLVLNVFNKKTSQGFSLSYILEVTGLTLIEGVRIILSLFLPDQDLLEVTNAKTNCGDIQKWNTWLHLNTILRLKAYPNLKLKDVIFLRLLPRDYLSNDSRNSIFNLGFKLNGDFSTKITRRLSFNNYVHNKDNYLSIFNIPNINHSIVKLASPWEISIHIDDDSYEDYFKISSSLTESDNGYLLYMKSNLEDADSSYNICASDFADGHISEENSSIFETDSSYWARDEMGVSCEESIRYNSSATQGETEYLYGFIKRRCIDLQNTNKSNSLNYTETNLFDYICIIEGLIVRLIKKEKLQTYSQITRYIEENWRLKHFVPTNQSIDQALEKLISREFIEVQDLEKRNSFSSNTTFVYIP